MKWLVLLVATLCQAKHECHYPKETKDDFKPVFDFDDNWSFKDCGEWNNRDVAAPWRVAVSRTYGRPCFGIFLSDFDFVTMECKKVADKFRKAPSSVKAYTGTCYDQKVKSTNAPSAECTGHKVESVAALGKDSDKTRLHMWRLTAAVPDTKPICLFNANRKYQGNGLADFGYQVFDRNWKGHFAAKMVGAPRSSHKSKMCVKIGRSQSNADKNGNDFSGDFLVKEVGGRMTLRGFFFWPMAEKLFIYTDVAPFIKELVANSHNMFIMPQVPPPKTKTDFSIAPTLNKKDECGLTSRLRQRRAKQMFPRRWKQRRQFSREKEEIEEKAVRGDNPWHASLSYLAENDTMSYYEYCGATLISTRVVVTAAHCFNGQKVSNIQIVLGMHNIKNNESSTRQYIHVINIFQLRVFEHVDFWLWCARSDTWYQVFYLQCYNNRERKLFH